MKILVTGANGYLGRGIVKQLLDEGCEVIATDLDCSSVDSRALSIPADLFSLENPYCELGEPEVLLHLAWRNGFVHNSFSHIEDLVCHAAFLSKMAVSPVKRIAVMGSMHEIGFFEGAISDSTPCNPESLYGISKNALRKITELECKKNGKIFQWLRGFYIVGNTEVGNSIFSKLVQASRRGDDSFPFTSGLNQFDFLDYPEFALRTAHAVEQDKVNGIINICSGRPEKLGDRVERFIRENDLRISLNYGAFPDRPYDSKAIWGDDLKIRLIEENRK